MQSYSIYGQKTGQYVARLRADGVLKDVRDARAGDVLGDLLRRDIVIRDEAGATDDLENLFPDETMCYFGMVTLRPAEPGFIDAFVRRLPYISDYVARPVDEA